MTENGENFEQCFMMVMDGSHKWIRLKITTMQVNEIGHKIQNFGVKLYNDQFYGINHIS